MTRQNKQDSVEDYKKVIDAVRDYIFENHRFPQLNDLVKIK